MPRFAANLSTMFTEHAFLDRAAAAAEAGFRAVECQFPYEVEAAALARLLSREHDARPDVELHLKADRNARYGVVRRVVRAGRDAGFADVALVAEKVDAPPASVREDRP